MFIFRYILFKIDKNIQGKYKYSNERWNKPMGKSRDSQHWTQGKKTNKKQKTNTIKTETYIIEN